MSAKAQLVMARELGHELTIESRPSADPEGMKMRLHCTCGYLSTWRRSKAAANQVMAWHLGNVIADALAERARGA